MFVLFLSCQFHDKVGPMLETLESMASRLHMAPSIPAEVEKIRDCIGDNKNTLMELEKLLPSFEALKHRGEELLGRSQGADMDPAAKGKQASGNFRINLSCLYHLRAPFRLLLLKQITL